MFIDTHSGLRQLRSQRIEYGQVFHYVKEGSALNATWITHLLATQAWLSKKQLNAYCMPSCVWAFCLGFSVLISHDGLVVISSL